MTAIKTFFSGETWQKLRDLKLHQDTTVGGVCGALGDATPLAAWMWRTLFCTTGLLWGAGVVAYLILWVSIPAGDS